MAIDQRTLGAAIKKVRVARGLTQAELAAATDLSSGGKSIALIEQGKRFVSMETLNRLARALEIPPACLAVLGSESGGDSEAATAFMESLKHLISTIIVARAEIEATGAAGSKSKRAVKPSQKRLSEAAHLIRTISADSSKRSKAQMKRRKATIPIG
jgi:transcriptional regulator with XRE-family HTH domain